MGPRPLYLYVTQKLSPRAIAHGLSNRKEPGGGGVTRGQGDYDGSV